MAEQTITPPAPTAKTAKIESAWITMSAAAALIGVSRPKVKLLIQKGHLATERNIFNKHQLMVKRADAQRIADEGIDGMQPMKPRRRKGVA